MNITITVKMTPVLLLCSGFFHFTFASNRLRFFRLPETEEVFWKAALDACHQENESLVTLYDNDDANFTAKFAGDEHAVWLGLRWGRNTTWSDGVPIKFSDSSVNVTNGEQMCEAIDGNTWRGFNCSERKPFMCYEGNNYTLIENKATWCQALQYCRKFFTDLVSISNNTQNEEVIEKGNNTSFWIGLMHDEWEWTDKSCSSFRKWSDGQDPANDKQGTVHVNSSPESLYKYQPSFEASTLCSKGIVRIKVIEQPLTWIQAFDYCKANHTGLLWIENEEDQRAVEQWLNRPMVNGPFWIGLRQSRVFGFWIWTSDMTVAYSNWKNGKQPEMPLSNHCGVIEKDDYRWRDENCWLQLPFLCEEEIVFSNK